MAQLCLYVDDSTMDALRQDAAQRGKSLSRFVVDELKDRQSRNGWPAGWFDLYGAFDEGDGLVEPEELPWNLDAPRRSF